MRFNPRARLDSSQVRTSGGSGGGRLPGRMPMAVPGGIGGLLLLVAIFLATQYLGGNGGGAPMAGASQVQGVDVSHCQTGADANQYPECAMVATVNTIQGYWGQALPDQAGVSYADSDTHLFRGSVSTGCGGATSQVGPFYCPVDDTVYLDTTFFDAMLEGQLGAEGGPFAEAYVVAHEYGHHVQDLLGTMEQVRSRQGASSDAVRLELQADCLAGMWTRYATSVTDESGEPFLVDLTQDDIDRAIDAAEAVGDDRIQARAQGQVNPETWTHGSAQMRKRWFRVGLQEGTLRACDTFAADRL